MRLGFLSVVLLKEHDINEVAALAKRLGYDCIEIGAWSWAAKHLNPDEVIKTKGKGFEELKEKYQLTISALTCHINHLHPESEERANLNQHFAKVIESAAVLKVPVVTALTGVPLEGMDKDKAWEEFKKVMQPHVDLAGKLGIKIAVETFYPFLAHNIPTIEKLFEIFPDEHVGLNFDPSHFLWQEIDYLEVLRRFAGRIFHTHAKDTEVLSHKVRHEGVAGQGWWRFRIPGWGQIDWKALLSVYREIGYDNVISFEHEDPLFGAEEGLIQTGKFLRNLIRG